MDNEILLMIAKRGVFAVLFVLLLFYVLKYSRYREQNYQKLVNTLTKELGAVMDIDQDVKEIITQVTIKSFLNAEEMYEG